MTASGHEQARALPDSVVKDASTQQGSARTPGVPGTMPPGAAPVSAAVETTYKPVAPTLKASPGASSEPASFALDAGTALPLGVTAASVGEPAGAARVETVAPETASETSGVGPVDSEIAASGAPAGKDAVRTRAALAPDLHAASADNDQAGVVLPPDNPAPADTAANANLIAATFEAFASATTETAQQTPVASKRAVPASASDDIHAEQAPYVVPTESATPSGDASQPPEHAAGSLNEPVSNDPAVIEALHYSEVPPPPAIAVHQPAEIAGGETPEKAQQTHSGPTVLVHPSEVRVIPQEQQAHTFAPPAPVATDEDVRITQPAQIAADMQGLHIATVPQTPPPGIDTLLKPGLLTEITDARKATAQRLERNGGKDVWGVYNSSLTEYTYAFRNFLQGRSFESLLEGIQGAVVIDLMASSGTLAELFANLPPDPNRLGIAVTLLDQRSNAEKERDARLGIHVIEDDFSRPLRLSQKLKKVMGEERKANYILENGVGALYFTPIHPQYYREMMQVLWEILSEDEGTELLSLPILPGGTDTVDKWAEILQEQSIAASVDTEGACLFITRTPDAPPLLPANSELPDELLTVSDDLRAYIASIRYPKDAPRAVASVAPAPAEPLVGSDAVAADKPAGINTTPVSSGSKPVENAYPIPVLATNPAEHPAVRTEEGQPKVVVPPVGGRIMPERVHRGSSRVPKAQPVVTKDTHVAGVAEHIGAAGTAADALRNTTTLEGVVQIGGNERLYSERYHGNPEIFMQLQQDLKAIVTASLGPQISARLGEFYVPGYVQEALDQIHDALLRSDTNIVILRERKGNRIVGFTYAFTNARDPKTAEIGTTAILEEYRGQGGLRVLMDNLDGGITEGDYTEILRYVPQENGYDQRVMDHARERYGKVTILNKDLHNRWFGQQTVFTTAVPGHRAALARLEANTALAKGQLTTYEILDYATTIHVLLRQTMHPTIVRKPGIAASIMMTVASLMQAAGEQAPLIQAHVDRLRRDTKRLSSYEYEIASKVLSTHAVNRTQPGELTEAEQRAYAPELIDSLKEKKVRAIIREERVRDIKATIFDLDYLPQRLRLLIPYSIVEFLAVTSHYDLREKLLALGGSSLVYLLAGGPVEWQRRKMDKVALENARREAKQEEPKLSDPDHARYWQAYDELAQEFVDSDFEMTYEYFKQLGAKTRGDINFSYVRHQAIMASRLLVSDPDHALYEIAARLQEVVHFPDLLRKKNKSRIGSAFGREILNTGSPLAYERGKYFAILEKLLADKTIQIDSDLQTDIITIQRQDNMGINTDTGSYSYMRGFNEASYYPGTKSEKKVTFADLLDAIAYTDNLLALNVPSMRESLINMQKLLQNQLQRHTHDLENGSLIIPVGEITLGKKLSRSQKHQLQRFTSSDGRILLDSDYVEYPKEPTTLELVHVRAADLSVGRNPLPMEDLIAAAKPLGLEPCPIGVAPMYVLQYLAFNGRIISPAMYPVDIHPTSLQRFTIKNGTLTTNTSLVDMSEDLIFVRSQRPAQKK